MNENLNLVEILKNCPKGTKLYSTIFGEVEFVDCDNVYQIIVTKESKYYCFTSKGVFIFKGIKYNTGECTLFPSKDQRDWSKFKPKRPKFDPKTLQPFDKVLVRDKQVQYWRCSFFSHKNHNTDPSSHTYKYATPDNSYKYCIPYNDDTKHLAGTYNEAPEFYRYWED